MGLIPELRRRARQSVPRSGIILAIAAVLSGCYYRGCACYDPDRRGHHDGHGDRDRRWDHDRR